MKYKNTDEYWYKKYVKERFYAAQKALELQAKEYDRRLGDINHEYDRIKENQRESIPREVFDRTMQQKDERYERSNSEIKAVIEELKIYKTKQEGSLRVLLYLVSIGVTILVGLLIKLLLTGKGL